MKTMTINDIAELRSRILEKTEEVNNLTRAIEHMRTRYSTMDIHELNECIHTVVSMRDTIEENKRWIDSAKKQVNAFYAPAVA